MNLIGTKFYAKPGHNNITFSPVKDCCVIAHYDDGRVVKMPHFMAQKVQENLKNDGWIEQEIIDVI